MFLTNRFQVIFAKFLLVLISQIYLLKIIMNLESNTVLSTDLAAQTGSSSELEGLQSPFVDLPTIGSSRRIEAENFDLGGQGIAYNDLKATHYGTDFRADEGVDIIKAQDEGGGYGVSWLRDGEWLEYTTNVTGGTYDLKLRVASAKSNPGSLKVKLDNELLREVDVTGTNGWQQWQTLTVKDIKLPSGEKRTLRLEIANGGNFNINWLEFEPATNSSKSASTNYRASETPGQFKEIAANDADFYYTGRIEGQNSSAPVFSYPGSMVEFKFSGTGLKVKLSEDNWGGENYVDVYLNDNPEPKTILLKKGEQPHVYDIASGLENKVHKALLVKRNDYVTGEFNFHGIVTDGELLPANFASNKKIEVYGDSISAGATVESNRVGAADPPGSNNELANAYLSFGAILARNYDAEVSLVAQGGVPLVDGYGFWNQGTGMEAFYDKSKPFEDAPQWNFDSYNPDLIIIALGQNDASSINLNSDMSSQEWKNRYKQFIRDLRAENPNAYFIGMFPNMYHDRRWDNYLTEAIAEYKQETSDRKVYSLITEQVTPGHPRFSEQKAMADALKTLIDGTLIVEGFNWDVAE